MSDDTARNQAVALFREGKVAECIEAQDRLLSVDQNDDQAWSYLGAAHSQRKDWEQAISSFQRSLALKPSCRAYYNVGLAFENAGKLDEASNHFAAAMAADASYQPAEAALNRVKEALAQLPPVESPPLLNQDQEDPNAVSVQSIDASSSPVWADTAGLDLSVLERPMARQRGSEVMERPPTKEEMDQEREVKALALQQQMTRSGLIYGTGIGAIWYVIVFFCTQLIGFSPILFKFAEGNKLFLLIFILAVVGAGIGAAVGYAVGRTGGGEAVGMKVGAAAGLIIEPIKSAIGGAYSGPDLLVAAIIGIIMGGLIGYVIAQLVELSIGWN